MNLTFLAIACFVAGLALVAADRKVRRDDMRRRLGRMVVRVERRPSPETDCLPEVCPCCSREMSGPVGRATEITPEGCREIIVCSICVALGPMDSIATAAVEETAHHRHADQALPCDPPSASDWADGFRALP